MKQTLMLLFVLLSSLATAQSSKLPETWQPLSISQMQFDTTKPLSTGESVQEGFKREIVRVEWRKGDPIDLYIVRPLNAAKPPVVLFLYSWPSDTDKFMNDTWCRTVAKHGFAAIGFVSALTGQRYHDRPWKSWFLSEMPEALGKSVHDVQLLLNYLDERKDLDTTRIGIFGQGSGGTIALLAASVEPRLKAIDVIDPWGDWPDWYTTSPIVPTFQRSTYTAPEFQKSLTSFDPINVLPQLKTPALRLQQSSLNPSTPASAKERLQTALPVSATYLLYRNEEEYRTQAMQDGKILNWLQEHL